jgi:nickel-type superoxide dismutase maturation protease
MEPALRAGDWLIVMTLTGLPRVGDIVLARDPREPERLVLKRVAAVRDGTFELLGDHPGESTDSRVFGRVPRNDILGRAIFRYAPLSRVGSL